MLPLAPGRFSTTTWTPRGSASFCASVRAMMSEPPPGGYVTTRRTGLAGKGCAPANGASVTSAAAASSLMDVFMDDFSSLEQIARDQHAMDFRRAFANAVMAHVAVKALDRESADQPLAAEDL